MNSTTTRTRFAPSPTGMLHIGGLRTALFGWLWARKNQGEFILRLENTDRARLVEGAADQIMDSMRWLGLDWDYGPDRPNRDFGSCVQSERLEVYQELINILINKGVAYRDWTSPEQLAEMREAAMANKKPFVFRRNMATLDGPAGQEVIRIAVPDNLEIAWNDNVRGDQSWQGSDIGDFVAIKSDGYPTYQFANVVDDHLMGITDVIRADEWLSSTPKHLYLYDQFDWDRPTFTHVPPIMGPDGKKKLSKRDGAKDAAEYASEGYMPEAVVNFLALLGWNPGTEQEIFSIDELIKAFGLDRIQKSGASFDPVRLDWMNGMHIRALETNQRQKVAEKWWGREATDFDANHKNRVLDLVFERIKKWSELPEYTHFFFTDPARPSAEEIEKETKYKEQEQAKLLADTRELLGTCDFSEVDLEAKLYGYAKANNLKVGKYFMLIRMVVTGGKIAPGLFETLSTLGQQTTLRRLG